MRAVIFRAHGSPEKLEYVTDFPEPAINDDEALVRVRATALNHLDIWVRQGLPGLKLPLPHISGCDISGEIFKTGRNVKNWKQGDAVIVAPGISCFNCKFCKSGRDNICATYGIIGEHIHGGLAELVKVKKEQLLAKPENLSFEEAAAFPLTFLTAWHMLHTHAQIAKSKSVAVLGAASGIGVAALQIAKLAGAGPIFALGSAAEKLSKAEALGATHAILVKNDNPAFYREILKATDGQGVDIVFEHVGPATMESSIKSLKKGGIIVTCGATTGAKTPLDLRYFFTRELRLQGSIMGTLNELKEIVKLVEAKKLKPVVDSVFPLEKTREAQEKMLSRDFFGKIVIKIL
ncbi:MAG: zinc-binding dehydrogenase [Elusimicrobia bacterium]|nr:zinc-binding dehydrogenase [Elusimicrobiota bacterium]